MMTVSQELAKAAVPLSLLGIKQAMKKLSKKKGGGKKSIKNLKGGFTAEVFNEAQKLAIPALMVAIRDGLMPVVKKTSKSLKKKMRK